MSRRRPLRGALALSSNQQDERVVELSHGHRIPRRAILESPGTKQDPVNLSDDEGSGETNVSTSRFQRLQKRQGQEEVDKINKLLKDAGVDIDDGMPLDEKKNLLKILKISCETTAHTEEDGKDEWMKSGGKTTESNVNTSYKQEPAGASKSPAGKDEEEVEDKVGDSSEDMAVEETESHSKEERTTPKKETTHRFLGRRKKPTPSVVEEDPDEVQNKSVRPSSIVRQIEESTSNSELEIVEDRSQLSVVKKRKNVKGISKVMKRNMIQRKEKNEASTSFKEKKPLHRRPVEDESKETTEDSGDDCTIDEGQSSPLFIVDRTRTKEIDDLTKRKDVLNRKSQFPFKDLSSPVTFKKIDGDTSISDEGLMNSPAKKKAIVQQTLNRFLAAGTEDESSEDESIIKRPQNSDQAAAMKTENVKDAKADEEGMAECGDNDQVEHDEPIFLPFTPLEDTPGLSSSPDLFASQGNKETDDKNIPMDEEATQEVVPQLESEGVDIEISNGPFDVFYASLKASKKMMSTQDNANEDDDSTQDCSSIADVKKEDPITNEEKVSTTEANSESSRPCTPTSPTALLNKCKAKRKIFDPHPYFAPSGVDPLTYTATILSYFDQYRTLLRQAQARAPIILNRPPAVVVGRHIPNTLDLYYRGCTAYEVVEGDDDDIGMLRGLRSTRHRKALTCDKDDDSDFEVLPLKPKKRRFQEVPEKEVSVGRIRPSKAAKVNEVSLQESYFKNSDFRPLGRTVRVSENLCQKSKLEILNEVPSDSPPSGNDDNNTDLPSGDIPKTDIVGETSKADDASDVTESGQNIPRLSRSQSCEEKQAGSSGRSSPLELDRDLKFAATMNAMKDPSEKPKEKKAPKRNIKIMKRGVKRFKNESQLKQNTSISNWLQDVIGEDREEQEKEEEKKEPDTTRSIRLFDVSGDEKDGIEEKGRKEEDGEDHSQKGTKRQLSHDSQTLPQKKQYMKTEEDDIRRNVLSVEKTTAPSKDFLFESEKEGMLSVKKDGTEKYGSKPGKKRASRRLQEPMEKIEFDRDAQEEDPEGYDLKMPQSNNTNRRRISRSDSPEYEPETVKEDDEDPLPFASRGRNKVPMTQSDNTNRRRISRSDSPEYKPETVEEENEDPIPSTTRGRNKSRTMQSDNTHKRLISRSDSAEYKSETVKEENDDPLPSTSRGRNAKSTPQSDITKKRRVSRSNSPEYEPETIKEPTVNCPLCQKPFGQDIIVQHAATCEGIESDGETSQRDHQAEDRMGFGQFEGHTLKEKPSNTETTSNSDKEMGPCPVCDKVLQVSLLEAHVLKCLDEAEQNPVTRMRTRHATESPTTEPREKPTRQGQGRLRLRGALHRAGNPVIDMTLNDSEYGDPSSDQTEDGVVRTRSKWNQTLMKQFIHKQPVLGRKSPHSSKKAPARERPLSSTSTSTPPPNARHKKTPPVTDKKRTGDDEMFGDSVEESSGSEESDSSVSDADDDVPLSAAMSEVLVKKKLKTLRCQASSSGVNPGEAPLSPVRSFRPISSIQGETEFDFKNQFVSGKTGVKRKRGSSKKGPKKGRKSRKKVGSRARKKGKSV